MSQTLPERRAGAPERWEPLSELEQATERMRRMLEQTFGGFGWPAQLSAKAGWSPLVDLEEMDDAYVLEAELPGVKREHMSVELVGNELTVTGQVEARERKGTLRRQARRTGRFDYRVSLPGHVDTPVRLPPATAYRVTRADEAQARRPGSRAWPPRTG